MSTAGQTVRVINFSCPTLWTLHGRSFITLHSLSRSSYGRTSATSQREGRSVCFLRPSCVLRLLMLGRGFCLPLFITRLCLGFILTRRRRDNGTKQKASPLQAGMRRNKHGALLCSPRSKHNDYALLSMAIAENSRFERQEPNERERGEPECAARPPRDSNYGGGPWRESVTNEGCGHSKPSAGLPILHFLPR